MDNYEYIIDSFTKEGNNVDLSIDNLKVGCITSKNNNFNLDSNGNLVVKSITAKEGMLSKETIANYIYPVGSIYMSVNNVNPANFFGGTWEQIRDRFLLACGSTYSNGATGGEATHQLTVNEMPSHYHNNLLVTGIPLTINSKGGNDAINVATGSSGATATINGLYTSASGCDNAHNNMPPYLAVYMWKRTS